MSKLLDQSVDHGVSQLINSENQWAMNLWDKSMASHWSPKEVDMATDIKQWKNDEINEDEKLLVKRILGLFSAGESLVSNSIFSVESRFLTDGCVRQYLCKKNFEESIHNVTVAVCCEAYKLKVEEVAEAYKKINTVKLKAKFLKDSLDSFNNDFNINSVEGRSLFIKNMFIVYMIMEGTWFFSAFCALMSLGRQNKLPGLYEQIDYTISDETRHVEFGTKIINQLKEEYPKSWTKELQNSLVEKMKEGVEIEIQFLKDALPNGLLGINAETHELYTKFLANRRLEAIGLPALYPGAKNPYTWIAETQDSIAMTNFFEGTVRDYQSASVLEDDF
jgi:ribonucleoside-diphosphate reductase beta chain